MSQELVVELKISFQEINHLPSTALCSFRFKCSKSTLMELGSPKERFFSFFNDLTYEELFDTSHENKTKFGSLILANPLYQSTLP